MAPCCLIQAFHLLMVRTAQEEEEFELWPEWTLGPDTFAKNNELISNKRPRCIQIRKHRYVQSFNLAAKVKKKGIKGISALYTTSSRGS